MGGTCREVEDGVEYYHADPKKSSENNLDLAGLSLFSIMTSMRFVLGESAKYSFIFLSG